MQITEEIRMELEQAFSAQGLRSTRQREQVYALIRDNKNHPTAEEVYMLSRASEPNLSLATVYNCLEILVNCDLIREVNADRPPVRYERNHGEHAHFFCEDCGEVFDIELSKSFLSKLKSILPAKFKARSVHIRFQGHADCENVSHCHELAEKEKLTSSIVTRQIL